MKSEYIDGKQNKEYAFSFKGMAVRLWENVFTLVKANLCFILFCIPIVTIPAAISGIYMVCINIILDRKRPVFKTFLKTLKENFLKSLVIFLILNFILFCSGCAAYFYISKLNELPWIIVLAIITAGIFVITFSMLPSCYEMQLITDLPLRDIFKNGFLLAFLNIKYQLLGCVLGIALLALQILFFIKLVPFIIFIGIAIIFYVRSYFNLYGIHKFIIKDEII